MDKNTYLNNIELYKKILESCDDIKDFTVNSKKFYSEFSNQLEFNKLNEDCYNEMYLNNGKPILQRQLYYPKINNLENTCKLCWKFYLNQRNNSIKGLDIQLGQKFQKKIISFLNTNNINCQPADNSKKIFPDNVVLDNKNEIIAYLEIKYQSAPWLFAYRTPAEIRECYESTPALDIKKLEQQQKLITDGTIKRPIYYIYWIDLPCIKGIFFIDSKDISVDYKNHQEIFIRKARTGDYSSSNKMVETNLSKIHISLYKMKPFSELINLIKDN